MTAYTTPRTANVGDIFTAAWYNAEIRDDIKSLREFAISSGSSFPASPVSGQRHLFVSGNTRMMFTYDGTNWISDELAPVLLVSELATPNVTTSHANVSDSGNSVYVDVKDALAAGCTLQARLVAELSDNYLGGAATNAHVGINVRAGVTAGTIRSGASPTSRSEVSATVVATSVVNGIVMGPWGDVLSGSSHVAQLGVYAYRDTGSATLTFYNGAIACLRYKK